MFYYLFIYFFFLFRYKFGFPPFQYTHRVVFETHLFVDGIPEGFVSRDFAYQLDSVIKRSVFVEVFYQAFVL